MLALRVGKTAPRRPPRVLILGPPGSGRCTQAAVLAKTYGLVHISTRQLLKAEAATNPKRGRTIRNCLERGDLVPEAIVN
jgi:adenylate kinase